MSYNKFIASGNQFELYEYEKDRYYCGKAPRRPKTKLDIGNVDDSGEVAVEKRSLGRRQDSARRATMAFRRLVLCNLRGRENPILVTLTYAENVTSLRDGYRAFTAFADSLRYKYGKVFRYIAVPEFQERGAVHFHALFWDLQQADDIVSSERNDRTIAKLWGKGFVYLKKTDGNERLSSYLAKYMAKAFKDPRMANFKAYVASRNVSRPIIGKGFGSTAIPAVLEEWGLSTAVPLLYKNFDTYWLGKGRYSLYELN